MLEISTDEIKRHEMNVGNLSHQTTAIMMFPIVRAPIKDQTVEEMVSFLRLVKARARMMRTKSSLMVIFALSGNGHFMGSELWRG